MGTCGTEIIHITQEAPSQRRHFRIKIPIAIVIDGATYQAADWSLGGFRIDTFEGAADTGELLVVQLILNFQGFYVFFYTQAEVVRIAAQGHTLAARFVNLSEREKELLGYFIEGFVRGEISSARDVIQRIDIPVTPVLESPEPEEISRGSLRQHNLRRLLFTLGYFAAGGVLGLYLLVTLYGHFYRLHITSAVVAMPVESVSSLDPGHLEELFVAEGMAVQAGQALLRLEDDNLSRDVESKQLQLAEARLKWRHAEARRQQEVEKMSIYLDIAQYKLALAQESVMALTTQHRIAGSEQDRMRAMLRGGQASQRMLEEATARYVQVGGDLKQAQAELKIAEAAVRSVRSGHFFDGDRLTGDLPSYTAAVEEALEQVGLAEQALRAAERRAARLTYRAPFAGRLVRIFKAPGSAVVRGETLVWLEKRADIPAIDAFLTQDEVAHVELGSRATLSIPALKQSFQAKVVRIDRTSSFLNEMQKRYGWRGWADKSAHVRLVFLGLAPEAKSRLAAGMPAVVNMPKSYNVGHITSAETQ